MGLSVCRVSAKQRRKTTERQVEVAGDERQASSALRWKDKNDYDNEKEELDEEEEEEEEEEES